MVVELTMILVYYNSPDSAICRSAGSTSSFIVKRKYRQLAIAFQKPPIPEIYMYIIMLYSALCVCVRFIYTFLFEQFHRKPCSRLPTHLLRRIYKLGLQFLFPVFRAKMQISGNLFEETLI